HVIEAHRQRCFILDCGFALRSLAMSDKYVHKRAQQFTSKMFCILPPMFFLCDLPAPGYYDVDRTLQNVLDTSPRFSFGGKPKAPKIEETPAPGAYSPEKSETALNAAPSYTFGSKYKEHKPDNVPAPNSYNIPDTIGGWDNINYQSPRFTMGGKEGDIWGTNKNPGPGSYNVAETDKIKQKSPAYTMSHKTDIPTDKSKKPGPGAHSPEKVVMQHSPSYSFGIKHSPYSHQYQKEATTRDTETSVLETRVVTQTQTHEVLSR
ncbi:Outer dense fiber protein 3, partial [Araneus ventricosus]